MDFNFSEMSVVNLVELKMSVEKEISRRRKENLKSLVSEFKNTFLDANDYMYIKLLTYDDEYWVNFSNLAFFDKKTGEEINI